MENIKDKVSKVESDFGILAVGKAAGRMRRRWPCLVDARKKKSGKSENEKMKQSKVELFQLARCVLV